MTNDTMIKKICTELGIETPTLEQYQKVDDIITKQDDYYKILLTIILLIIIMGTAITFPTI